MKIILRSLLSLAASRLLASFALATSSITVSIDGSKNSQAVASDFIGMCVTRSNIIQPGLFDSTGNPDLAHYTNIVQQMGIKHWRVGSYFATPVGYPATSDDDNFFSFVTNTGGTGVMYDLSVFNAESGEPDFAGSNSVTNLTAASHILGTPADAGLLQAFGFGNEPDPYFNASTNSTIDPSPDPELQAGKYSDYETEWNDWRTYIINNATNGGSAKFCGPDCSTVEQTSHQVLYTPTNTKIPFILMFAHDESSNLVAATGHRYMTGATSGDVPVWGTGTTYCVGDEVISPTDSEPYQCTSTDQNSSTDPVSNSKWKCLAPTWASGTGYSPYNVVRDSTDNYNLYMCTTAVSGSTDPKNDPAHWVCPDPIWVSGTSYVYGNIVRDPSNSDKLYTCIKATSGTLDPANDSTHWSAILVEARSLQIARPGPYQIALSGVDPAKVEQDSETCFNYIHSTPSGYPAWPSLKLRMTEFSPVLGNELPNAAACKPGENGDCFGAAILGLDALHWWCRTGAAGVDPISNVNQVNSPIYFPTGSSTIYAAPWAYSFLAFNIGAQPGVGKELWQSDNGCYISSNPGKYNMSAYGVLASSGSSHDLYVTIINKTIDYGPTYSDGTVGSAADVTATVNWSNLGWTPTNIRHIRLISEKASGDGTAMQAYLGGIQIDPTQTTFSPSWATDTWSSGSSYTTPSSVGALTAWIVDIRDHN